jgi:hypothetical protein
VVCSSEILLCIFRLPTIGGREGKDLAYRNKVYVCFDGDSDIHYYRLMKAWHQNDHSTFSFFDAHDINYARDSSQEFSIKAQLRVRLQNTKIFVVLIGQQTRYLTKFVKWEMEQALALNLPIIAVNLNGLRQQDPKLCPPTIRDSLAIHISFNSAVMQYALQNWPARAEQLKREGKREAFYYPSDTYRRLGIC